VDVHRLPTPIVLAENRCVPNVINLYRLLFVEQAFPENFSGLIEAVVLLGATLDGAGFKAAGTVRIHLELAQFCTGLHIGQSAKRIGEADTVYRHTLARGGGLHDGAHEVID
jgi:hypothetical protein